MSFSYNIILKTHRKNIHNSNPITREPKNQNWSNRAQSDRKIKL